MKISVILCSYGRPAILDQTVLSILRQTVSPHEILIATPSGEHVNASTVSRERIRHIVTPKGLTVQRNAALDNLEDTDLVVFLDDDIELCSSYLAKMQELFEHDPQVVVASGKMLADGGRGVEISREQAIEMCSVAEKTQVQPSPLLTQPLDYGYGCNLVVRGTTARQNRFDERLSLYAWLEDSDYSHKCTRNSAGPVTNLSAMGVHLGWRGGRISAMRMGYSQIVNPIYLWRKDNVFPLRHVVIQYWSRCFLANCFGVIWSKPEEERVNRLKGNVKAFWHLLRGKCDPMLINELT